MSRLPAACKPTKCAVFAKDASGGQVQLRLLTAKLKQLGGVNRKALSLLYQNPLFFSFNCRLRQLNEKKAQRPQSDSGLPLERAVIPMSTPNPSPSSPSGGFVPVGGSSMDSGNGSGQPPRRRPGCWLWGGLSCLTLVLIFAAFIAIGAYKVAKSGFGKQLLSQAFKAQDCQQKITQVRGAIVRYHEHTGHYPATLAALAPTYIDATALHCTMDKSSDPTHPTFAYRQPPAATSENAAVPLLSFHFITKLPGQGSMTQVMDIEYVELLDGTLARNQNQKFVDASGKVVSQYHSGSNNTLGPGSTGM